MAVVEQERETARAQARWVHSSARKARLVTDLIRGRSVPEARTILAFSNRAVAKDVEKVLRSAVANAESRPDLHWQGDDLVVITAYVDEGPTLKRWRARARGRVARIRKRTCHITIELAPGLPTSAAPSVPAMAPPEPVEPKPVEEPEAVEEPQAAEEETTEEPEAVEEETTEEPEAVEPEASEEPEEDETETPQTEGPSAEAQAEASTEEEIES
jgi:large subunit ribosomal protein L22